MNKPIEPSCTWKDASQCLDCPIKGHLECRWSGMGLAQFFFLAMPGMLGTLAGAVLLWVAAGVWWIAIAYLLFFPIVLGIGEIRFLCSHCPYYAENSAILHCPANHGAPKIWKYRPEPMNRLEKILMEALIALFLLLIPGGVFGYAITYFAIHRSQFGILALLAVVFLGVVTLFTLATMAVVMLRNVCSRCVNFSCPFNRVKRADVDAYLMRNPTMRKAWEEKGYHLGSLDETPENQEKKDAV